MSKTLTLQHPETEMYGHFEPFSSQWKRHLIARPAIARHLGITLDELYSLVESCDPEYTLQFWLVVQYFNDAGYTCREGFASQSTFRDILQFLARNQDRFPELLKVLDLEEREFFDFLISGENLDSTKLEAVRPLLEQNAKDIQIRTLVAGLMIHLTAASVVALECNGDTPEVIRLLAKEDQGVLDSLRALLCPQ